MSYRSIPVESLTHILDGLDHLEIGITIFDDQQRLVVANQTFLRMYDYPDEMAIPGTPYEIFIRKSAERGAYGPGDADAQVASRLLKASAGESYSYILQRDAHITIEVTVEALQGGGMNITHKDISHLTLQQERLREQTRALMLSEERLSLIADEVPAGIAQLDKEMNFLYTNKRFAAAYHKTPAQVTGLNASDLLPAKTLRESARFFEQARRGVQVDFEMRIELPGARIKDIRTLLRPDERTLGQVIGFYLVSIDVTRRKSTMSALMRSQKMDALGRMASGISHDFNNLLTIILGNLVPLADQTTDQSVLDEFLLPAIAAARRGSSLTKRLVTLARREQYDPIPTDIGEAIAEIANLVEASIPSSLQVKLHIAPDMPPANVDRSQLEMAILNLALNARDATEGVGVIGIKIDSHQLVVEEAEDLRVPTGDYIRVRFSDDGCGMSQELADKIFEPFFTSKAAGSGSGLGLSMVYGFVQQSNGAIYVDSSQGEGTTFTILLPCERDAHEPLHRAHISQTPETHPAFDEQSMESRIVLLVEDDLDVRRTVRRKIAGLGYAMVEASSAEEAYGLLKQVSDIGIVLSDIDMPGGQSGLELAQNIFQDFPGIYVILMSGDPRFRDGRSRRENVPFLEKPFDSEDFTQALFQATRDQSQREMPS